MSRATNSDLRRVDAEKAYRLVAPTLDLFMPKLMKAVEGHGFHCETSVERGFWESEQVERAIDVLHELEEVDAVNAVGASLLCPDKDKWGGRSGSGLDDGHWFTLQAPWSFMGHGPTFEVDGRMVDFGDFKSRSGMSARGIRVTTTVASGDAELDLDVWRWIEGPR